MPGTWGAITIFYKAHESKDASLLLEEGKWAAYVNFRWTQATEAATSYKLRVLTNELVALL